MAPLDPSPLVQAYERGSFAPILTAATATNTPAGTAAPAGSIVYGLAPSRSNDQAPTVFTIQIDNVVAPASLTVRVYGSCDGINFYAIDGGTGFVGLTGGQVFIVDKAVRYITAAITTITGASASVNVGLLA
jgi:hypothetical protein